MDLTQYENLRLVAKCERMINPFDDALLEDTEKEHPDIAANINGLFNDLNGKIHAERDGFMADVIRELKMSHLRLVSPEEVSSVFSEPLYIRNYMYSVKTDILNRHGQSIPLDLGAISRITPGAHYSKKKTPSMILFSGNGFCCAILTKKGNINIVGGYTENEVKYTLSRFFVLIQQSLEALCPGHKIVAREIALHNQAVSTTIAMCKIDIYNCTSFAEMCNTSFVYLPDTSDFLTINPFPVTRQSIRVRVFPSGGLFCFGVRALHEINIAMSIVASLIGRYIRRETYTIEKYTIWKDALLKKWMRLNQNKIRRRDRKIAEWNMVVRQDLIQAQEEGEKEEKVGQAGQGLNVLAINDAGVACFEIDDTLLLYDI